MDLYLHNTVCWIEFHRDDLVDVESLDPRGQELQRLFEVKVSKTDVVNVIEREAERLKRPKERTSDVNISDVNILYRGDLESVE